MNTKIIQKVMSTFLSFFFLPLSLTIAEELKTNSSSPSHNPNSFFPDQLTASLPPTLSPWIKWVTARHPEWSCAKSNAARECEWMGRCKLNFRRDGLSFTLHGEVLNLTEVRVVGSLDYPPLIKTVRNLSTQKSVEAPLYQKDNGFYLTLPKGEYVIEGELYWEQTPREIPVPDSYALVEAFGVKDESGVETQSLEILRGNNLIWFQEKTEQQQVDKVNLLVARRLIDGSPLKVETLLDIGVSGNSRSVNFGNVAPIASTVVEVNSALPYQLNSKGVLSVQVAPGNYKLTISSILQQPVNKVLWSSEFQTGVPQGNNEEEKVEKIIWPESETWVLHPNSAFRTVEIVGGRTLAADSALIPQEWGANAAYSVNPVHGVELKELSRGDVSPRNDALTLNKELWLDLNGDGFTVKDTFTGVLKSANRLNAKEALNLGMVTLNQNPALITEDPTTKKPGVEVRNETIGDGIGGDSSGNSSLLAVSRMNRASSYSSVGWEQNVDQLTLNLNLPPFWKLFSISDVGYETVSWVGSWSLLEAFLLILLVIGTAKLLGNLTGALVAASILFNHNEFLEPKMLLFHILIASVLCKLFEEYEGVMQRLSKTYLVSSVLLWCVEAVTLIKLQLTQILYPQLESGTRYRTMLQELLLSVESSPYIWIILVLFGYLIYHFLYNAYSATTKLGKVVYFLLAILMIPFMSSVFSFFAVNSTSGFRGHTLSTNAIPRSFLNKFKGQKVTADITESDFAGREMFEAPMALQAIQPAEKEEIHADKVQTGPALPKWSWRTFSFAYSGPVSAEHTFSIVLLSPTVNRVLSFLRLLCALWLMIVLLKKIWLEQIKQKLLQQKFLQDSSSKAESATATLSSLLVWFFVYGVLVATVMTGSSAYAETPSSDLLNELEKRLEAQQCQQANCAVVEKLTIKIEKDELIMKAKVVSDGVSSVTFPGPLTEYRLQSILVDGAAAKGVRSTKDGFLSVRTAHGISEILLSAKLSSGVPFTLQLPSGPTSSGSASSDLTPILTSFESSEWRAEGILPSGAISNSIRFVPLGEKKGEILETKAELGSWFIVDRSFKIGERNSIHTLISRLGQTKAVALIKLRMLPTEQIIEGPYVSSDGDIATIRFPENSDSVQLVSTVAQAEQIKLEAENLNTGLNSGADNAKNLQNNPQDKNKQEAEVINISHYWRLVCSQYLNCTTRGAPITEYSSGGLKQLFWQPYPNDVVEIEIAPLKPIAGDSLTVDELTHTITWGNQRLAGVVVAEIRNTAQNTFTIEVPKPFKIKALRLNGLTAATIATSEQLGSYLLQPGTHVAELEYEGDWSASTVEKSPEIKTSAKINNLTIVVRPSTDRWLLWTGGVSWGPAVLIWAKFLAIFLIVVVLVRFGFIGLSTVQTVFLALGLTTLPSLYIIFPLIWLSLLKAASGGADAGADTAILTKLKEALPKQIFVPLFVALTFVTLMQFYSIVETGLVLTPPMLVVGNSSNYISLNWYTDFVENITLVPWVLSISIFWWRALMLVWSIWLAISLLGWIKEGIGVVRGRG